MDELEKNVRQQILPSISGKNHIFNDDRHLFSLPLKMGGLYLLSNTDIFFDFLRHRKEHRIG